MFLARLLLETQWVPLCSLCTLCIMKPLTLTPAELATNFPPSQPPGPAPRSVRLSGIARAGERSRGPGLATRGYSACSEFKNKKPN